MNSSRNWRPRTAPIRRFPEGTYRAEAADLLAARQLTAGESWAPAKRELPLYSVPFGQSASKEATLQQAGIDAERLCRGFTTGTMFRFKGAQAVARTVSCSAGSCSFDGVAKCDLEVRSQSESETCQHR